MTEENIEDVRLKKEKGWIYTILKICFFLSAIFIIFITILANMGGTGEMLKGGVTQFASNMFGGRPATLDRLVNMRFFPSVGMDIEGLHVHPFEGSTENLVNVGKLRFYTSFWNVLLGTSSFRVIYVEDITIKAGVIGDREFGIKNVLIDHDIAAEKAELRARGNMGVYEWSVVADLQVHGRTGSYYYKLGKSIPVRAQIADLELAAHVVLHSDGFITLENLSFSGGGRDFAGALAVSILGAKSLKISGELRDSKSSMILKPEIVLDRDETSVVEVSGALSLSGLSAEDIVGDGSLFAWMNRIAEVVSFNDMPHSIASLHDFAAAYNLDLSLALEGVNIGEGDTDNLTFLVNKAGNFIRLSKISGTVDGIRLVTPDFFILPMDNGSAQVILSSGAINPKLSHFLSVHPLPSDLLQSEENLDILCGLARVSLNESGGYNADNIDLHFSRGTQSFGKPLSYPVILDERRYTQMDAALAGLRSGHPCLACIAQENPTNQSVSKDNKAEPDTAP